MKVYKVIIHELFKPIGLSGAKLSKSKTLMDPDHDDVIRLIDELNKRYRRKDEKQGIFDVSNPTKFHDSFREYFNDNCNERFIEFSHKSAENLRDRIEGIGAAKGGYLVYAQYEDYRQFCSVFFVRDTVGIAFKRNKTVDSFNLDKVQHIDFEKLAMACRINMEFFSSDDKKYLSFIQNRSDSLSQYFVNWISTSETVTSEEETKQLLKALRTMPLPILEETTSPLNREDLIKRVHSHIHASPTKTINLFEISKTIFNDDNFLPDYIYINHPTIPTEFKAHATTLRQFVKVYAKADNIELNFYPTAYKEGKIKFDENDESQLIIKSKDLVEQIKASLPNE